VVSADRSEQEVHAVILAALSQVLAVPC